MSSRPLLRHLLCKQTVTLTLCAAQARSVSNTFTQDAKPAEKQCNHPVGNGEDRDMSASLWDLGILYNASLEIPSFNWDFQY